MVVFAFLALTLITVATFSLTVAQVMEIGDLSEKVKHLELDQIKENPIGIAPLDRVDYEVIRDALKFSIDGLYWSGSPHQYRVHELIKRCSTEIAARSRP